MSKKEIEEQFKRIKTPVQFPMPFKPFPFKPLYKIKLELQDEKGKTILSEYGAEVNVLEIAKKGFYRLVELAQGVTLRKEEVDMKGAIMSSEFDDLVEKRAREIGMMYYNEWQEKEMQKKWK